MNTKTNSFARADFFDKSVPFERRIYRIAMWKDIYFVKFGDASTASFFLVGTASDTKAVPSPAIPDDLTRWHDLSVLNARGLEALAAILTCLNHNGRTTDQSLTFSSLNL